MQKSGTYEGLDIQYKREVAEYEAMMLRAIQTRNTSMLAPIRAQAEKIQSTLNQMIESITFLKKETPDIRVQRDDLLEKLRRIQKDYNEMISNSDDLETLRRIRMQESDEGRTLLYRHLAFFLLLAIALLGLVLFMGSQKKETIASIAPTPAISPTLV